MLNIANKCVISRKDNWSFFSELMFESCSKKIDPYIFVGPHYFKLKIKISDTNSNHQIIGSLFKGYCAILV